MMTRFVYDPSVVTPTVTLCEPSAPAASGGSSQVTTPLASVPPPVALTNVVPGGRTSVSRTLSTGYGPGFA